LNVVKALGRRTGSTRTDAKTELAPFWEGNASVHRNQAANQTARANHLSMSDSNRLLAVLNIAMADTALTIRSAKRHYGHQPRNSSSTSPTQKPSPSTSARLAIRRAWPASTSSRVLPRPLEEAHHLGIRVEFDLPLEVLVGEWHQREPLGVQSSRRPRSN
jgi:hypothetical protein